MMDYITRFNPIENVLINLTSEKEYKPHIVHSHCGVLMLDYAFGAIGSSVLVSLPFVRRVPRAFSCVL
jgi:hypothetical protein